MPMPQFTETVEHSATVIPSGNVEVARDTITLKDGEVIARQRHRYVLEKGADLSAEPEMVAAVALAAWSVE
jgi:lipopolysaccharide export system protein LptA